jgi:uncharacterized protein
LGEPLKILCLADEKPGHYHLSEGVIAAAGLLRPVEAKRLAVKRKWIVPTRFLRWRIDHKTFWPPRMLRMAYRIIAEDLPKADLVVSAGGETLMPNICAARYLSAPNIFCGSLRGLGAENFTLVISSYDRDLGSPNHLVTLKPSAIDPGALGRNGAAARHFDANMRPERIGLLIGGNAGLFRYRRDEWQRLLAFVKDLSAAWGTRWLISTSRRTPDYVADAVARLAEEKSIVEIFIDFRIAGPGTLPQIYAQADVILCTEDSSSMMSEAVSAQLPVVGVAPALHRFTQEEADYRAFMLRRNWCRVLPIAGLRPDAFGTALSEIEPLTENPLHALAAKLRERLPSLFCTT